ncbi:HipA family kinase [Planctellipticum variicoloris]|uniref:HipA family kinase n=1 Tax=Planctellipticum variicoloris TaxID=3064265 RepID=UPI00301390E4|nr:hypothetical protein SH412_004854 [Planctomycetaceae bacterium SH412]
METDVGSAYVKAMGGPEGPHTLASEVVVTQLAAWFGLSTFDWAIVIVDEFDEIPFLDKDGNQTGQATPGPSFITRAEQGVTWGGGDRELKLLVNPQDISRLVVFDTWVLNCDRHSPADPETGRRRKPNRDNVFLSEEAPAGQFLLKAMDHTHCFTCGREWTRRLGQVDTIRDSRVFGLFPEFRKFLKKDAVTQAATDLRTITAEVVREMIDCVPNEWDVKREARNALVDLVVGRAIFVAETIETRLWPQGSLFPDDEEGNPER